MIAVIDAQGNVEAIVSSLTGLDMTGRTSRPAVPADYPPRRVLSLFEYLQLWTPEEATWFKNTTDPVAAQAFVLTLGSPVIDLDHPQVVAGISYAAQAIPLSAERVAQILAGVPPTGGAE